MKRVTKASAVSDIRFDDITPASQIDPSKLLAREEFAAAIVSAWGDAQHAFLQVGRFLEAAKSGPSRLPHGEFMAMVERDLPFSQQTANKLMGVARLVDSGAIDASRLPPSSESCYLITTLTLEEREKAINSGVISPTARREDIIQFKRSIRSTPTLPALAPPPIAPASPESIDDAVTRFRALLESDVPGIRDSAVNLLLSLEDRERRHRAG